ncbi:TPA: glycosyltransferase family 2 protein [Streptococcus suis]|uniref:Cps1/2K n=1 Tax=Streptococcus suis TaxID=1307 RepID=G8DTM0_STRSU|nr:glycosyltransferase family 2 protein [Streptococcus suis]AEH57371.1 Cps1/2K [Streptococcus suis]AHF60203.1 Glycosyltransferases involved in cell wall biogenesis [Streptococcus suis 05HAS68]AUW25455.1 glycosyltransferase family 2 protein [Streptococcus suis]MBL1159916.1 glycosyltransferase family 2 protein [Streptococcus suis]MBS0709064.1 glycosyltransferase family 2 protein [Streptococcus suis]
MINISIIVPIYNVEQYLSKCINSIVNQTYKHIEILLVNDGSTDNSEEICLAYAKKDSRIRYFKKENGGLSDARNYGISRAKGDYLAFIDSDDFIHSEFIQRLHEAIERENALVAVAGYDRVDASGHFLTAEPLPTNQAVLSGRNVCKKLLEADGHRFVVACNKLYKKELFEDFRFEKGKIHEDEYFTYRLLYELEKVAIVKECLYYYVDRENSITTSSMTDHRFHCLLEFQNERMDFYESRGDKELLLECYRSFLAFAVLFLGKYNHWLSKQQKKLLQTLFRIVYKQLKQNKRLALLMNAYYLVGCLHLNFSVFLKTGKDKIQERLRRSESSTR